MLRFMDLRWPGVYRRSNLGLVVMVGDNTLISVGCEVFKKHFTSFYK